MALIIFAVFAPRFLFRGSRISHELHRIIDASVQMNFFSEDFTIVDYRGQWAHMYSKLKVPSEWYDPLMHSFLSFKESTSLSTVSNIKRMYGYQSMNLENYEECFVAAVVYGRWFTTISGETNYALVKENDGNCYLYICV